MILQRQLALIDQVHGKGGSHRFGDGGDAVLGVIIGGLIAARNAVGVSVDDFLPFKGCHAAPFDPILLEDGVQLLIEGILIAVDMMGGSGWQLLLGSGCVDWQRRSRQRSRKLLRNGFL